MAELKRKKQVLLSKATSYFTIFKKAGDPRFFLLLCLIFSRISHASPPVDKSFYHVINLDKQKIASSLFAVKEQHYKILLKNYYDAIDIILNENRKSFTQFLEAFENRMKVLEELNEGPERDFTIYQSRFLKGFAQVKMKELISGSWNIRSAFLDMKKLNDEHPDYLPPYNSLGMMNCLISTIPEEYQWLAAKFGLKGNLKTGLSYLQKANQAGNPFQRESALLLSAVHIYISDNTQKGIEVLEKHNEPSLLAHFLLINAQMKHHRDALAIHIFNNTIQNDDFEKLHQLHYLKGELLMRSGRYEKARSEYLTFIKKYEGKSLIKDSYFKLACSHWLKNDDEKAYDYFKKVGAQGDAENGSDQYASYVYENGALPHRKLYALRLYTDGGFYEEAAIMLNSIDKNSLNEIEKLEYNYRKGRLEHLQNNINEALHHYKSVYKNAHLDGDYFKPNAMLQSASIFIVLGKEKEAERLLSDLLKLKNYPYKKGIEQKAKAMLVAIK